jgi:hypothetical protein
MMATGDVELDAELVGGRYRPLRELGRGGMGRVLLCTAADDDFARDVPEDQGGSATRCEAGKVALKLLEEPGLRRAFVAEFELLRRLTAPCFPRALELQAERETGRLVDVMEWCAGPQVSAQALGSREAVVALAADLLRGLDQLHGLGYAHGDVSTANVLAPAGEGETARLVDLGAAGRLGDGRGATSGALAFAAPERLEGAPLSVGADLWSLGVLVFSLSAWPAPVLGLSGRGGGGGATGAGRARRLSAGRVAGPTLGRGRGAALRVGGGGAGGARGGQRGGVRAGSPGRDGAAHRASTLRGRRRWAGALGRAASERGGLRAGGRAHGVWGAGQRPDALSGRAVLSAGRARDRARHGARAAQRRARGGPDAGAGGARRRTRGVAAGAMAATRVASWASRGSCRVRCC